MHVVLVFNRWDYESVDAVIGPFDSLTAAQAWHREHFDGGTYRRVETYSVGMELPEHAG